MRPICLKNSSSDAVGDTIVGNVGIPFLNKVADVDEYIEELNEQLENFENSKIIK